jgi:hypothetical protein
MKRFATFALAVLFVTSLTGAAMAERTGLSITGSVDVMARQDENQVPQGVLGNNGVDNRVEQKVNLNIDADLTDNVSMHLGLEAFGAWGDVTGTAANLNAQGGVLAIDEAYIEVKELFIEQLTVRAGIQSFEYSLRDDGNAMFLSLPEVGAWFATIDYDPLYVDLVIGKVMETRRTLNETDLDVYALGIEYYLENESKVQVIAVLMDDEDDDISLSQYSAGITYNVLDDLEVYAQLGGQGGELAANNADLGGFAFQIGAQYTFSKVTKTPYVGVEWQSFSGDDDAGDLNWQALGDVDVTIVLEADRDLRDHGMGTVGKLLVSNYQVIRVVGGCVIDEKTKVDAQIAIFQKQEEDATADGQSVAGTIFGQAAVIGAAADDAIGTEFDVTVTYQLTDDLVVTGGIGYVASGDAIDDTSGEDDALVGLVFTATLDF